MSDLIPNPTKTAGPLMSNSATERVKLRFGYDYVESPQFVLHGFGHYHEEYRKADGAWRIARLKLTRLREDRQMK